MNGNSRQKAVGNRQWGSANCKLSPTPDPRSPAPGRRSLSPVPGRRPPVPRGFTLVEMLVVMVIIAILAGLISGAAMRARVTAKNAVIASEVNQLDMAVKAYQQKYGDYPPDFTQQAYPPVPANDQAVITRHLAMAFPRYTGNWQTDLQNAGIDVSRLDASTALVLWLGGMPTIDNMNDRVIALTGFCANPSAPFDVSSTSSRTVPFFDFDIKRLRAVPNQPQPPKLYKITYLPPNGKDTSEPYVYFRFNYYLVDSTSAPIIEDPTTRRPKAKFWPTDASGNPVPSRPMVRPYYDAQLALSSTWTNASVFWVNRTAFQILCPGLDGKYWRGGADPQPGNAFLTGTSTAALSGTYTPAQYDDITNFSGGTLESKMP